MPGKMPQLPWVFTVAVFLSMPTLAEARCPTVHGFAAFKRCALEADSPMERNNLRRQYEQMLEEDLANARPQQQRDSLEALGITGPLLQQVPPDMHQDLHSPVPSAQRGIEAEIGHRNRMRQQRNFDTGRARNQYRLDQGRVRSQNLLSGTGNRW